MSYKEFDVAIDKLKQDLSLIRAGRANPNILNDVMVMYYGNLTPLNTVANITVPDFKNIFIKPFEKGVLKDIEKGINEANIGITPINNGEIIILTFPDLTEETRKDYVKQAKSIGEEAKIQIRNIRQSIKTMIEKEELPEDTERREIEDLQKEVDNQNKIVDEIIKEKEKELMSL